MTTMMVMLAGMLISGVVAWRRYVIALRELTAAKAELQRLATEVHGAPPEECC